METIIRIEIIHEYSEEINKEIQKFCSKIATHEKCISLDTREGINRTEYKFRGEEI